MHARVTQHLKVSYIIYEGAEAESTAVWAENNNNIYQTVKHFSIDSREDGSATLTRHVSNNTDFCRWQCHGELVVHVFFFRLLLGESPQQQASRTSCLLDSREAHFQPCDILYVQAMHAHQFIHLQVDAVYKCSAIYKPLFTSWGDTSACAYKPDLTVYKLNQTVRSRLVASR